MDEATSRRTAARLHGEALSEHVEALGDYQLAGLLHDLVNEVARRNDADGATTDTPWNPWAELRRRWPGVELHWGELHPNGGGLWQPVSRFADGTATITLDPRAVNEAQGHIEKRRAWRRLEIVLTHELTHDDRAREGGPYGFTSTTPADVVDAEEAVVWAITRERMRSRRNGTPAPPLHRVMGT